VRYRIYEDEETGQVLSLEDHGGRREVRMGEPAYEGEFHFHGGAGAEEERAWDTAVAECDAQAADQDDDVTRGSPMAAAMALEGRMAGAKSDPATFASEDPIEFDDAEWADAEDVEEENSFLAPAEGFAFADSAGWLEPTLYVAGAEHEAPEESEDDWLTRS
jgi:hypothetical protein